MKKSKKHLSRLGAYLKKESSRLEKLISRTSVDEDSALIKDVVHRLSARRDVALADLGLVDAAEKAMRKLSKAPKVKKAPKAKKASGKRALPKVGSKSKKAPRKAASPSVPKRAATKRVVRRKPKSTPGTSS